MRLLSIEIFGEYKGLRDQAFDFSAAVGSDVAVLIGANGSGKSQVMEIIAEVFAYLERRQREEFRVRDSLGYDFRVAYQLASSMFSGYRRYIIDTRDGIQVEVYEAVPHSAVATSPPAPTGWSAVAGASGLDQILLPRIVGYASGLSENLQRPFMRNALQFHDVIRVRSRLKKELAQPRVDERKTIDINNRYLMRYPGVFSPE